MTAHAPHGVTEAVLYDDCARCEYQALNLWELDTTSLRNLANLARYLKDGDSIRRSDLTNNEVRAIEQLRLMARVVFASEITRRVAK